LFLFSIMYFMYISRSFESGTLISSAILIRADSPVHGTTKKEDFHDFFAVVSSSPALLASENISDRISTES